MGGDTGGDADVGDVGGEGIGETGGEVLVMDIDEGPLGPPEEILEPAQPEVNSVETIRRLQLELEECQVAWDREWVALIAELDQVRAYRANREATF